MTHDLVSVTCVSSNVHISIILLAFEFPGLLTDRMRASTPHPRLHAAQMYFYTELRSSLGNKAAERWLSGTSASCAGSCQVSSVANTPTAELPAERRKNNQLYSNIQASRCQPQASSPISAADTPRCLSPFSSSESLTSEIDHCNESHEGDMIRLINDHGEKAGLLFTDVAHELLDSPHSEHDYSSR